MQGSPISPELEEIFHKALELPSENRPAYLDTACGLDIALRAEIESLLRQSDPVLTDMFRDAAGITAEVTRAPVLEGPGSVIGRFKLLQQIGEGGFGVVFMAEQTQPVQRKVALKIIKLGMDTRQVVARFEAERQALAMMDHPHIAKVLDAGSTDTGRPYFVMELVKGVPMTSYCNENRLSTQERLDLFVQVCSAVQHAHQKGIIHRDIKPSNVLVTMNDGKPAPKVIDFGIAKATQGRLTDKTLFTEFRQMIGTPAYMSPEQAQMSAMDVDTRSDIYSLGVLLYELLTDTTPFDSKQLMLAAYDEVQRIIREVEPPRPSTRLSALANETLTTVADQRRSDPKRLSQMLRGDLDWIIMKCLEKDRTRRYETASGLAMDIQRHLDNEPVVARPASATYRFRKMVRRNKLAFVAGSAILAALVVGGAVSTWQAVRATKAERRTKSALDESETARTEAQAVSNYLTRTFYSIDPMRNGRNVSAVDLLDRAVADLGPNFAGSDATKAELLDALGQSYGNLGLTTRALDLLEQARKVVKALPRPDHHLEIRINIDVAQAYRMERRMAETVPLLEETLTRSSAALGPDDRLTLGTIKSL